MPKGYAHIDLPTTNGQSAREAYIYSIIRNESWLSKWIPFCEAEPSALDNKEIERVVIRG